MKDKSILEIKKDFDFKMERLKFENREL
jgi:hypothetical protein